MKFQLIFTILFCCIWRVRTYNDSIEKKQTGSAGAPEGEYMMQRITLPVHHGTGLFWKENEETLVYVDKAEDNVIFWNYDNGKETKLYIQDIAGEQLAFCIPLKSDASKYVLGSDNKLRIMTVNNDGSLKNVEEPFVELSDDGYYIHQGLCDKNGKLFIVTNSHTLGYKQGGKLYQIVDNIPQLVMSFPYKTNGFVWSYDWKNMYIICDDHHIYSYDYNMQNGSLSNDFKLFTITDEKLNYKMTAIETDVANQIWATADRYILRITDTGNLTKVVQTPFEKLTSLSYGGYKNKNLLVGSTKKCAPNDLQGGSTMIVSGFRYSGRADVPANIFSN